MSVLVASCVRKTDAATVEPAVADSPVLADTFAIQAPLADRIAIYNLGNQLAPDNTGITKFRIEFSRAGKALKAFNYSIPFQREAGSWMMSNEVFADSLAGVIDRRFVILTNGFEACGYPQYSLMFFADGKIELIDRWISFSDGGMGDWREFFPIFSGGLVTEFRSRRVSAEPVDGPAGTTLVEITYRDSTHVQQAGQKWVPNVITVPDVRYRTEVLTENEYYQ